MELRFQPSLIIHGGVVDTLTRDYSSALAVLERVCLQGWRLLAEHRSSLDVVEEIVYELEVSGAFLAGRGACPNSEGQFELDGSIMEGRGRLGAGVAAAQNAVSAIRLARYVMANTEHALIVGEGVRRLVNNSATFFAESPSEYYAPIFAPAEVARGRSLGFGTVGAAAMDSTGLCAAATATSGVLNKRAGRVGDTAILGAGTWAGPEIAVSCTGQGEYFLRSATAAQVECRTKWLSQSVDEACQQALADVAAMGGAGGLIAAHKGGVSWAFNTVGLKRAWIDCAGNCIARVD